MAFANVASWCNALLRSNEPENLGSLTDTLQKRFSATYTPGDVGYAVKRLVIAKLAIPSGKGKGTKYRPSREALAKWRALPKRSV